MRQPVSGLKPLRPGGVFTPAGDLGGVAQGAVMGATFFGGEFQGDVAAFRSGERNGNGDTTAGNSKLGRGGSAGRARDACCRPRRLILTTSRVSVLIELVNGTAPGGTGSDLSRRAVVSKHRR